MCLSFPICKMELISSRGLADLALLCLQKTLTEGSFAANNTYITAATVVIIRKEKSEKGHEQSQLSHSKKSSTTTQKWGSC